MIKYALWGLAIVGIGAMGLGFGPDKLKGSLINVIAPPPRELEALAQLKREQEVLGAFIATTSKNISATGTADQKKKLQQAQEALVKSKALVKELETQIQEDLPGVASTLIKKLISPSQAEPTSIPPQCKLVCQK